jgi:hypothetical protein
MFFIQFFLGSFLIFIGIAIWWAGKSPSWRSWIEKTFLSPGDKLFDARKSYSIYVKWMRYVAFFAGLAMVVPTAVLWDLIIGMIAAGLFWWMNRQKIEHDDHVSGRAKAKTT